MRGDHLGEALNLVLSDCIDMAHANDIPAIRVLVGGSNTARLVQLIVDIAGFASLVIEEPGSWIVIIVASSPFVEVDQLLTMLTDGTLAAAWNLADQPALPTGSVRHTINESGMPAEEPGCTWGSLDNGAQSLLAKNGQPKRPAKRIGRFVVGVILALLILRGRSKSDRE